MLLALFSVFMFALFSVFMFALFIFLIAMKIYGVYLAFSRKWYFGVISLLPIGFAEIVAVAKFVFKKDLLK